MITSYPETVEQAKSNLFEFADILEDLGITFWLDGGTLLGAYRDHTFCDGDEDDIDLFVWADNKILIPTIIKYAEQRGFILHRQWDGDRRAPGKAPEIALAKYIKTQHGRFRLKIDLFFIEKKGDDAWGLLYISPDTAIPQVCKAKFYENLGMINFHGRIFNIPSPVEEYLTVRYGDWKTPIHRIHYHYTNADQLRVIKHDFKFYDDN